MEKGLFWVFQLLILGTMVPLALFFDLRPSPLATGIGLMAICAMAYGAKRSNRGALFCAGLFLVGAGASLIAGRAGTLPALTTALIGLLAEGLLLRDLFQLPKSSS